MFRVAGPLDADVVELIAEAEYGKVLAQQPILFHAYLEFVRQTVEESVEGEIDRLDLSEIADSVAEYEGKSMT